MIRKFKLIWILPVIVIIPIVINWLQGRSSSFNIATVGESKDWLAVRCISFFLQTHIYNTVYEFIA
jgi:hypothetical protein